MTAGAETFGFPPGYFVIRSVATDRMFDVEQDEVEDGTEVVLWPPKESSIVESMRSPGANNQVFFIDTSGALCSRSSGHALDIEDGRLVLRHRRPVSYPFPNAYSHPLPRFSYDSKFGEISVTFSTDPDYPPPVTSRASIAWKSNSYILASIPQHKPRTIIDDASQFLTTAISAPMSFLSGLSSPKATPEQVFDQGDIDLMEDEVLDHERGEEGEVDDSPDGKRLVRMVINKVQDGESLGEKARKRRQWIITPLRISNAKTTGV